MFWDTTPCSPLKVSRRFGGTCRLHLALLATCFYAGFLLSLFLTLKTEATCSSETSFGIQQTAWCYIPEDKELVNIKMGCREIGWGPVECCCKHGNEPSGCIKCWGITE
jgi:hypothetical protein